MNNGLTVIVTLAVIAKDLGKGFLAKINGRLVNEGFSCFHSYLKLSYASFAVKMHGQLQRPWELLA